MSYVCFHSFKIVVSKNFIFKNIFFKNHIRATSTCLEELKYKKNQPSLGESPNISLLDTTLSIPSLFISTMKDLWNKCTSPIQLIPSLNSSLETFRHLKHDLNRREGIIWPDLYLSLELFMSILENLSWGSWRKISFDR